MKIEPYIIAPEVVIAADFIRMLEGALRVEPKNIHTVDGLLPRYKELVAIVSKERE